MGLLSIESYYELKNLTEKSDKHYKQFTLESNGKSREIKKPVGRMKDVHKKFSTLARRIKTPSYHMSKKGSFCKKHAELHVKNDYLYMTDISNFFPSCKRERLAYSLKQHFKMSGDIAFMLSKMLTFKGRVPQGGNASDIVCFWSNYSMFQEIDNFCNRNNLAFSLYVDDVAISSMEPIQHDKRYGVEKILQKHGFEVKKKKTKYFKKDQIKHITGMAIKDKQLVPEYKKCKKLFTLIDKGKEGEGSLQSILGLYNYLRDIQPNFAPSLEREIKKMQIIKTEGL